MIKAKPQLTENGTLIGNDLVDVGVIDATGADLRKVAIDGDLTAISAGSAAALSILRLDAASLGRAQADFPGVHAGLTLAGGLGKAFIGSDVLNFSAVIGQRGEGLRKLVVGGEIVSATFQVDGTFGVLHAKSEVVSSASRSADQ